MRLNSALNFATVTHINVFLKERVAADNYFDIVFVICEIGQLGRDNRGES